MVLGYPALAVATAIHNLPWCCSQPFLVLSRQQILLSDSHLINMTGMLSRLAYLVRLSEVGPYCQFLASHPATQRNNTT